VARPSIDSYYLAMLPLVASRATCPRRQVAAILVDVGGKLVSIGYNGPPAGMPHCIDTPCPGALDKSGDTSRCIAIHAEINALSQAQASRRSPHALYCSTTPCFNCAKMLITEGVKRVVAASDYPDQRGVELLRQAGVVVELVQTPARPKVVCLCGSTKFKDQINATSAKLSLEGNLVISLGLFGHTDLPDVDWTTGGSELKRKLDELHKRKIDLADEILIVNVGGYVGESTQSEIEYAIARGKTVKYLEETQ
jgi:deoxycytidylate deaminase